MTPAEIRAEIAAGRARAAAHLERGEWLHLKMWATSLERLENKLHDAEAARAPAPAPAPTPSAVAPYAGKGAQRRAGGPTKRRPFPVKRTT